MKTSRHLIALAVAGTLPLLALTAHAGEPESPRDDGQAAKVEVPKTAEAPAPAKADAPKKDAADPDDLSTPLPPLEPAPEVGAPPKPDVPPAKSVAPAKAPTTATTAPKGKSADEMIGDLLKAPPTPGGRPLQSPETGPMTDKKSGPGAVKPNAPAVTVLREGSFVVDRIGRLTKNADGSQAEFTFESDGGALRDPPVVIVPNLKLMAMEDAVQGANRDLRFRATGMVTEYRGRNYILLEKVVVVPEATQQYNPNKNQ